jgi:hypothetical protein
VTAVSVTTSAGWLVCESCDRLIASGPHTGCTNPNGGRFVSAPPPPIEPKSWLDAYLDRHASEASA